MVADSGLPKSVGRQSQRTLDAVRRGFARSAGIYRIIATSGFFMTRYPAQRLIAATARRQWLSLWLALVVAILQGAVAGRPLRGEEAGKQPLPSPKQTSPAETECRVFRVRAQDQVWVVSTRCLGCPCGGPGEPAWQIWRYEKGWWQPKTLAEFYATDSAHVVTPFYIHGNRIDHPQACQDGLSVYFQMVGKFDDEPPARFVIWSWPSSQIKGPLNDVRTKAARSDVDAYYLARFLADMQPDVRAGLIGYSFGARIASGAMHLLGNGSLLGWQLAAAERPQVRIAMWAAAEHNHWYLPGNFHDRALATGDAWFVTINCCDPVLSRYHNIDPCSNPVAVGYAGIYGRNLLPADVNARVEEVNVTNIVGGTHDMQPYLYSRYIQDRTREYVLWHELVQAPSAGAEAAASAK